MQITFGETRVYTFPMFDFGNIPPNSLSLTNEIMQPTDKSTAFPAGGTLILGDEGWWRILGIVATRTEQSDTSTGLTNGTNVNIQIFDAMTNKPWFQLDVNDERAGITNQGAPLEHVAGKWGQPKLLPTAIVCPPSTQLYLKALHTQATAPTASVPMWVSIYAQLQSSPTSNENYKPVGEPVVMPFSFNFATTNLARNVTATREVQMDWDSDVLIDKILVRSTDVFSTSFADSWDPRRISPEILLSLKGSTQRNSFFQPTPAPLANLCNQWSARPPIFPTYFRVKKGAAVVASILNQSQSSLVDDLELTVSGLLIGNK